MRVNGHLGKKNIGGIIYMQSWLYKVLIINKPSVEYRFLYLNEIVIKMKNILVLT